MHVLQNIAKKKPNTMNVTSDFFQESRQGDEITSELLAINSLKIGSHFWVHFAHEYIAGS